MPGRKKLQFGRYAGALLVNLLALLLAYLVQPPSEPGVFLLFLAAVMYSSWYGGRLAGLLAAVFATWAVDYLLLSRADSASVAQPEDILRIGTFALVSLLVSGVNSARAAQRRAEQLQQTSEQQQKWLEAVLNLMPTPLLLLEPAREPGTSRVIFANRAAQEVAGGLYPVGLPNPHSPNLGQCTLRAEPIPPDQLPEDRAARGECVEGLQLEWHLPTGTRSLLVHAQRLDPLYGHPSTVVMPFEDITALKQTEQALSRTEQRYRTLADGAPVGIFHSDVLGQRLYVNERWCEITGLPQSEASGYGWLRAVHPDDRDQVKSAWSKAAAGGDFSLEYRIHKAGGQVACVLAQASPLSDESGQVIGFVGTLTDITDRKREEEGLRRLAEQRASLVATVSHALRAPVAAALVNFDVLEDGILGDLSQEQRDYVARASRSIAQLAKTVDDLLTMSRLQDGRVNLTIDSVDLADVLADVHAQMLPRAQGRGVALELSVEEGLGSVETDRRQLACVTTELVENAVKYAGAGGRVSLFAGAAPDGVTMQVIDDGPGIATDELESVFEPFYRGQAAHRNQVPGTGLGLSIVKQTAQLLKIGIQIASRPGGGLVWTLTVPRSLPHGAGRDLRVVGRSTHG